MAAMSALDFVTKASGALLEELLWEVGPFIGSSRSLLNVASRIVARARRITQQGESTEDSAHLQRILEKYQHFVCSNLEIAVRERSESNAEVAVRAAAVNLSALLKAIASDTENVILSVIAPGEKISVLENVTVNLSGGTSAEDRALPWLATVEEWSEYLFRCAILDPSILDLLEQPREGSIREFVARKAPAIAASGPSRISKGKRKVPEIATVVTPPDKLEKKHVELLRTRYEEAFKQYPPQSLVVSPLWKAWLSAVHGPTLEAWTKELREAER